MHVSLSSIIPQNQNQLVKDCKHLMLTCRKLPLLLNEAFDTPAVVPYDLGLDPEFDRQSRTVLFAHSKL